MGAGQASRLAGRGLQLRRQGVVDGIGAPRRRALGVQLSKPGVYQLNPQGRAPQSADVLRSINLASKVVLAQVFSVLFAMIFMSVWMWRVAGHA